MNEWIPIKQMLPPPYTKVLLTIKVKEWDVVNGYHEVTRVVCKAWNGSKKAIAWMPIPQPYEKE